MRRVAAGRRIAIDGGGLIVSGIGQRRAGAAAERLAAGGARVLLSWGVAGGLAPGLRPGDLVIPERIAHADGETLADARLRGRLADSCPDGMATHGGALWSGGDAVLSPAAKRALAQRSNAVAVDMESAAVAAVAGRAGLPFVAVKAVCDPAERDVPPAALKMMTGDGRFNVPGLLAAVFGGPATWRDLIALGRDFAAARETLAAIAPRLLPQLYLDNA